MSRFLSEDVHRVTCDVCHLLKLVPRQNPGHSVGALKSDFENHWTRAPVCSEEIWLAQILHPLRGSFWSKFLDLQILIHIQFFLNRVSSVIIVTKLRAWWPGFNYRRGQEIFLFVAASRPALGPTNPPIQCIPAVLSPPVAWSWPPPSSAEVKNAWNYISISQYVFMAWCLVKYKTCVHCVVHRCA
jgi:hypothetical protein